MIEPRYLIGRAWNGFQRDRGTIYHATDSGAYSHGAALCKVAPGRRSAGWSSNAGEAVTCSRCIKRLATGLARRQG